MNLNIFRILRQKNVFGIIRVQIIRSRLFVNFFKIIRIVYGIHEFELKLPHL